MFRAKNYETVFTFAKVMQRKLLASFFSGHGVHSAYVSGFVSIYLHFTLLNFVGHIWLFRWTYLASDTSVLSDTLSHNNSY